MTNFRRRIYSVAGHLAVLAMMFSGGCSHSDSASVEVFLADLLRSVTAALLL